MGNHSSPDHLYTTGIINFLQCEPGVMLREAEGEEIEELHEEFEER